MKLEKSSSLPTCRFRVLKRPRHTPAKPAELIALGSIRAMAGVVSDASGDSWRDTILRGILQQSGPRRHGSANVRLELCHLSVRWPPRCPGAVPCEVQAVGVQDGVILLDPRRLAVRRDSCVRPAPDQGLRRVASVASKTRALTGPWEAKAVSSDDNQARLEANWGGTTGLFLSSET